MPGLKEPTEWKTSDVWMRRHFNAENLIPGDAARLLLRIVQQGDAQVFINGEAAYGKRGHTGGYTYRFLRQKVKKAIKPGADNVLAVHCEKQGDTQYIDV